MPGVQSNRKASANPARSRRSRRRRPVTSHGTGVGQAPRAGVLPFAPMSAKKSFKHVKHLWLDEDAAALGPVDRLVYRSNKLGEDLTLTNTGGGNTSSKLIERDPL